MYYFLCVFRETRMHLLYIPVYLWIKMLKMNCELWFSLCSQFLNCECITMTSNRKYTVALAYSNKIPSSLLYRVARRYKTSAKFRHFILWMQQQICHRLICIYLCGYNHKFWHDNNYNTKQIVNRSLAAYITWQSSWKWWSSQRSTHCTWSSRPVSILGQSNWIFYLF